MKPRGMVAFVFVICQVGTGNVVSSDVTGSPGNPIVDSAMSEREAMDGLDPQCPLEVRQRQKLIDVLYYSFDGKLHRGQLVIDQRLVADIRAVFEVARNKRFPIGSVIPISHRRFRKNGEWDDGLSMAANNTSAFNYRLIKGTSVLSQHAYGWAIDINPFQNPMVNGTLVRPAGARYDTAVSGTLSKDNPVVRAFQQRGWQWGGGWKTVKDFQHFEKALKGNSSPGEARSHR